MFTRDKKKWLGIVISFLIISIIVSPYLANAQYPGVEIGRASCRERV